MLVTLKVCHLCVMLSPCAVVSEAVCCLLQNHVTALRALLDNGKSLQPLIASADEFTAAVNEHLKEAKVGCKLVQIDSCVIFILFESSCMNDCVLPSKNWNCAMERDSDHYHK